MKRIFWIVIGILFLLVGMAQAAILQWDHAGADGFIIYYTDGTFNYNYTVVGDVRTCDTGLLNLIPGVEYTIYVTAYNEVAESGPSNTVIHIRTVFEPPANLLPVVEDAPGEPSGLQAL